MDHSWSHINDELLSEAEVEGEHAGRSWVKVERWEAGMTEPTDSAGRHSTAQATMEEAAPLWNNRPGTSRTQAKKTLYLPYL